MGFLISMPIHWVHDAMPGSISRECDQDIYADHAQIMPTERVFALSNGASRFVRAAEAGIR
jgi:hypothetical protein